jgi:methionyl-tRNA synthetase
MTTPKISDVMTKSDWQAEAFKQQAKVKRFEELAQEFRRLAAEARTCIDDTHPWEAEPASKAWAERAETWDEAAQMLEERLNG